MYYLPVITGISEGDRLTEADINKLKEYRPYGVVLRKENLNNSSFISKDDKIRNFRQLIQEILSLYPSSGQPIIWIDQEGGEVQRINPKNIGTTDYPAAASFGEKYYSAKRQALEEVRANYSAITQELLNFKIRGNFAPVADLWYSGVTTSALEKRSFSTELQAVIELASTAFTAIEQAGGVACLKHLPGHGRAKTDTHKELPVVDASIKELQKCEILIMQKLAQLKPKHIMLAHIIYQAIDPTMPATFSAKVISYVRNIFGSNTKIMTDAMDMKAVSSYGNANEAALLALEAGIDLILDYSGSCDRGLYDKVPTNKYIALEI